jgi:DNA-directed RNA polymerase subunit RPC12/RpoP
MGRYCSDCGDWCDRGYFSHNQWRKGDGLSRCYDCVEGRSNQVYTCGTCNRSFNTENELNMHMQVHRPRNVACPVCGERRFRSGANAVQHVESGYCSGCRGQENARDHIYRYAASQRGMQPYLTNTPLLTNGTMDYGPTPDYPYCCQICNKYFRQASQLLQHNDQKHGAQRRMLGY